MSTSLLNPELAAKAKIELNEDPSRIQQDIDTLRSWLEKQPHLSNVKISDRKLSVFLRGCKFSLERCKEKIDMYYTVRNIAPDIFHNRDPMDPKVQECLKNGMLLPLLNVNRPDGERCMCVCLGRNNNDNITFTDFLKTSYMITDILLEEDDNFVIAGLMLIIDLTDMKLSFVTQFTPSLTKRTTMFAEKVYPIRQKGNHVVNIQSGIEPILQVFRSYSSEKVRRRIYLYNSKLDGLEERIGKNILPKELGGNGETYEELTAYWKKKVESYRDWFLEDDKYKSDESKRLGKPKISQNLYGTDGSFRKLDFD